MSTQEAKGHLELLQGTLDLLILRTLIFGAQHGQGIARAIQQTSSNNIITNENENGDINQTPSTYLFDKVKF